MARMRIPLVKDDTLHTNVDYVTGGEDLGVSFDSSKLNGRIIASMGLKEGQSFTETNDRADDGAAFYSMSPVNEMQLAANEMTTHLYN